MASFCNFMISFVLFSVLANINAPMYQIDALIINGHCISIQMTSVFIYLMRIYITAANLPNKSPQVSQLVLTYCLQISGHLFPLDTGVKHTISATKKVCYPSWKLKLDLWTGSMATN